MFTYIINSTLQFKIILILIILFYYNINYFSLNIYSITFLNFSFNYNIFYFISFAWTSASIFSSFFIIIFSISIMYIFNYKFTYKFILFLLLYLNFTFIYSNNIYIYKGYCLDQLFLNNLLLNQLNHIHPFILYASFTFILLNFIFIFITEYTYENYIYICNSANFILISGTAVILGCWWALQEGDWGGWWAWDPSEVLSLWLFFYLFILIHTSRSCFVNNISRLTLLLLLMLNYIVLQLNFRLTSHSFVDSESVLNWFLSFYVIIYILLSVYNYLLFLNNKTNGTINLKTLFYLYIICVGFLVYNEFISYIFWVILKLKWGLNVAYLPYLLILGLLFLVFYSIKYAILSNFINSIFYLHLFFIVLIIPNLALCNSLFFNIINFNYIPCYYNYTENKNLLLNDYMISEVNFNLWRLYLNNNFLVYTPFRDLNNNYLSFLESYNFNNYNNSKYFLFTNNYLILLPLIFLLILLSIVYIKICYNKVL